MSAELVLMVGKTFRKGPPVPVYTVDASGNAPQLQTAEADSVALVPVRRSAQDRRSMATERTTTCPVCGTTFWNPKHPRHRFCSRKCSANARPITPWQESFWRYLTPTSADECWEWQGAINAGGYGSLKVTGKMTIVAHRASWEIHNGPIPDDLWVLHKCDNRPCCNPAHLFLGTHDDNMADMARKGRVVAHSGDNHWRRKAAMTARPAPEAPDA